MLKHKAKTLLIKEQYIDDPATGLTLIFEVVPSGEGRLHILGDNLPLGNRDFQFSGSGLLVGTGTGLRKCRLD